MGTHCYRLTLSYKGTHYFGWQKQPNVATVQGELEKALQKLIKADDIKTMGSGRTDAGVHALAQEVKVDLSTSLPLSALNRGLNGLLPQDIQVLSAHECPLDFHPVADAKSKEYIYLLSPQTPSVFDREFILPVAKDFNWERFSDLANIFAGEWDFQHYMCQGTPVHSTVREVFKSELLPPGHVRELRFPTPFYTYRVVGSGFLKQMVRLIVGTLIKGCEGRLSEAQIKDSLQKNQVRVDADSHLAAVAPAKGLFLRNVEYGDN